VTVEFLPHHAMRDYATVCRLSVRPSVCPCVFVQSLDAGRPITLIAFDAKSPRKPANIRMYFIFLETPIIGLQFAADSMGLIRLRFYCGLRKNSLFLKMTFRPFQVIQGH